MVQWDNYPGNGTLPPGNWLAGTRHDTISLNTADLDHGNYRLMIGFYDSITHNRLMPVSNNEAITILNDGRLVLQDVEIE